MNILITGINSVLGAELGKVLLAEGHNVIGLYNSNTANIPAIIKSYPFSNFNVSVIEPQLVFLIGSFVPRGNYNAFDDRFWTQSIEPAHQLLSNYPMARFVFASSTAVYGDAKGILDENSSIYNPSLYGISKLFIEQLVKQRSSWMNLRLSSLYGPQIAPNNFINRAISQAVRNKVITVFGNGLREQNYIYLDDAIALFKAAGLSTNNGTVMAVSPKSFTNKEVANLIMQELPGTEISYVGEDNSPSYHYDNSSTAKMLNFSAETLLSKGILNILKHG